MKIHLNIIYLFLIWSFCVYFLMYFGFTNFPKFRPTSRNEFLPNLANWDGGHYLSIAQFGYQENYKYAFFPLYPLAIRLVNNITSSYFYAAILISFFASLSGVYLFYKLITKELNKKIALDAVFFLLSFPTAFYFLAAYSEGLFFFLTIATFYFSKKNKLALATLTAALASATRIVGIAVALAFILEVVLTRGFNKKNWFIILSFTGFFLYCFHLYQQTADPFYFLTAQLHWQREFSIPGQGFWESVKTLSEGLPPKNFFVLQNLIFAVFGLGLTIRTFRFLPPWYSIYAFLAIILPLLTPTLSSIPRFILPIFPIFILLGFVKNKYLLLFYQIISPFLLAAFAILYINGFFVS